MKDERQNCEPFRLEPAPRALALSIYKLRSYAALSFFPAFDCLTFLLCAWSHFPSALSETFAPPFHHFSIPPRSMKTSPSLVLFREYTQRSDRISRLPSSIRQAYRSLPVDKNPGNKQLLLVKTCGHEGPISHRKQRYCIPSARMASSTNSATTWQWGTH